MRVLIADDDATTRVHLQGLIEGWGYKAIVCEGGVQAWNSLKTDDAPRLAIIDWVMPELDGLELCRMIRSHVGAGYVYILLLTAREEKDDVVQGILAGADDYLAKPFYPNELYARLATGRRILDLQDRLVAARDRYRSEATHDGLTGLLNRTAIMESARSEFEHARIDGEHVGTIILDYDGFKETNDTHGHQVGDAVLREGAERIKASVRPQDVIGRYGGEEFLIVVPHADDQVTIDVAERIRSAFEANPFRTPNGSARITISAGVAATRIRGASGDVDGLIRAADRALYRAKKQGRNRVEPAVDEDWNETPL